ncbi:hypothetical protein KBX37_23695 [Micromonospora sp. U56]|uniref:hypothetical protein n=1 Tax=Micromonospora sp. U56 TaxID=2824900 RepID=UPI001B368F37|nr:hypothetical protein [Micromonospora sp. U56]MBQ0896061.1 hypothetical protein [Micromonospora sp. U56]
MTDAQPARYCPYCGAPVPGSPRFCFRCGAGQAGHQPAAYPPPADAPTGGQSRLRRPWSLILTGAVAVLLIVAAVPLLVLRWLPDGPDDVARSYFEALAERDADKALALLDPGSPERADPPMLTDRILNDPGYTPPGDVEVEVLYSVTDTSTVKVDYGIKHAKRQLNLTLIRDDESTGWKIQDGLLPLPLPRNDAGWDAFLVSGTAVPASRQRLEVVFPGAYLIMPVGNAIREAPPITVWAGAVETERLLVRLRPTVREAIEPQVRAYLDACAESGELAPPRCPFRGVSNGPVTNINWTITHYPTLRLQLTSGGAEAWVVGEAGAAEVTGRSNSRVAPEFASSTTFSVSGIGRVIDGKVVFVPTADRDPS